MRIYITRNFGVGAYCGFGREPPSTTPRILEDHVKAAEAGP
jgi:hypothetical protein